MKKTFWFCAVGNAVSLLYLMLTAGWKALLAGFTIFFVTSISIGYIVATDVNRQHRGKDDDEKDV